MKRGAVLIGWLGAVALMFGLISFPFLLRFSGRVIYIASFDFWFTVGNAVLGLALLALALGGNLEHLRARMQSGGARRAGRHGGGVLLQTLLGVLLLVLLAFLSTRFHHRFDLTEARSHSLSGQTVQVLQGLDETMRATAVVQSALREPVRDFLNRYAEAAGGRFTYEFVDPDGQPGRLKELGVDGAQVGSGMILLRGGGSRVSLSELDEQGLTNAIVKLTRSGRRKVYFLTGRGERPALGEGADAPTGFAEAAAALQGENYEVEALLLPARGEIPGDANVVVAAGPERRYSEAERAALRNWVAEGGALLLLLDPVSDGGLARDLSAWGVSLGGGIVVDLVSGLYGQPTAPLVQEYAEHPVTAPLRDLTIFPVARSVRPAQGERGSYFEWIVQTGTESWDESDRARLSQSGESEFNEGADQPGPLPLAVAGSAAAAKSGGAAEEPATQSDASAETAEDSAGDAGEDAAETGEAPEESFPGARLVVVGDSDFASNRWLHEFQNRDFFLNAVNWLLGDVEAIAIRPEPPRPSRLQMSATTFQTLRILALLLLPEAIALLGVWSWWSRRRAPGR